MAAGISAESEAVAAWLILQTRTLSKAVDTEHARISDPEERHGKADAAFSAEFELMRPELKLRVWRWVSAGVLDERPMNQPRHASAKVQRT